MTQPPNSGQPHGGRPPYPGQQPPTPGGPQPGPQPPSGQPSYPPPGPGGPVSGQPYPNQVPYPNQPYPNQPFPGQPYSGQAGPPPGYPRPPRRTGKIIGIVGAVVVIVAAAVIVPLVFLGGKDEKRGSATPPGGGQKVPTRHIENTKAFIGYDVPSGWKSKDTSTAVNTVPFTGLAVTEEYSCKGQKGYSNAAALSGDPSKNNGPTKADQVTTDFAKAYAQLLFGAKATITVSAPKPVSSGGSNGFQAEATITNGSAPCFARSGVVIVRAFAVDGGKSAATLIVAGGTGGTPKGVKAADKFALEDVAASAAPVRSDGSPSASPPVAGEQPPHLSGKTMLVDNSYDAALQYDVPVEWKKVADAKINIIGAPFDGIAVDNGRTCGSGPTGDAIVLSGAPKPSGKPDVKAAVQQFAREFAIDRFGKNSVGTTATPHSVHNGKWNGYQAEATVTAGTNSCQGKQGTVIARALSIGNGSGMVMVIAAGVTGEPAPGGHVVSTDILQKIVDSARIHI